MPVVAIVRAAAVALALLPAPAAAQVVPQGGPEAERIREVLRGIRLPEGFRIALHALVPGARHMAVAPAPAGGGVVIFVGTRTDRLWAVLDRDGDGRAEEVRAFAPGLHFEMPNGPCFAPDGTLFVPELNRVRAFPGAAARLGEEAPAAVELVPPGGLVPAEEALPNHGARVCRVGPDGKLYVSLGQPHDVPPAEKVALYERLGIGGVVRMDRDGRNREVFARGIRNSVGLAFRPGTGELWFTDTDSNGLGDDLPPGEINRADAPGRHFGFPWYGGGRVRTEEFRNSVPPADAVFPVVETAAHATDLGLAFHEGAMFPPEYRGALFSAQRGSAVRGTPVGARVMVTFLAAAGSAPGHRPFAGGWVDAEAGRCRGRPVDVAAPPDGSLLVSDDDEAGALQRTTYNGAAERARAGAPLRARGRACRHDGGPSPRRPGDLRSPGRVGTLDRGTALGSGTGRLGGAGRAPGLALPPGGRRRRGLGPRVGRLGRAGGVVRDGMKARAKKGRG